MLIWYLARGAGIAAFASLSVATGAGAFAASRVPASLPSMERRVIVQYVHRAAALAGLLLLVAHIGFLLADSFARVGWLGALVPFASGYRPWQVSLGVVSVYLVVAVAVTGMLRSRLARSEKAVRIWRAIHLSSYLAWAMSAWHFLVSGTDSGTWWARLVLLGGIAVVGSGVLARLSARPAVGNRQAAPQRIVRPSASVGGRR
ncbi:MAG: hypothetical protein QOH56_3403 [Pseudonocardiales bacterium]|nr:hypothetical protein [Pseudonocardiales bacterium]